MNYTLVLDAAMLNVISQGLIELPFKLAAPVVAEIQLQINKQTNERPGTLRQQDAEPKHDHRKGGGNHA